MRAGRPGDRWTAAWMSLLAPGSGQLWLWHRSAWFWLAVNLTAWLLIALWCRQTGQSPAWIAPVLLCPLGLASAWSAQRLADSPPPWPPTPGSVGRVVCLPSTGRQVRWNLEVDLDLPAAELWPRVADLPRFLAIDPFHVAVELEQGSPRRSAEFRLVHCVWGWRFIRRARLLRWRPGRGYLFSDLSARGNRRGFPHVFLVELRPDSQRPQHASRLTVAVRGRWTAPLVPRWLRHDYLSWVMHEHARRLCREL